MHIEIRDNNFLYLKHSSCDAIISLQGAQLIHWQPKMKSPVLWSTSFSNFKEGQPFRGGIPICWPWFGKIRSPSHGFARLMKWDLLNTEDTDKQCHLTFTLQDTPHTRALFPHAFSLILKMSLGTDARIELFIETEVETTGALHTYFSTEDVEKETIIGLGEQYTHTSEPNKINHGGNILTIDKKIDRIYTNSDDTTTITSRNRTLTLNHQDHSDIVVWNPWVDISKSLHDMGTHDYKKMFCVETAKINKSFNQVDYISVLINP